MDIKELQSQYGTNFKIGDVLIGKKSNKHAIVLNIFVNVKNEFFITYSFGESNRVNTKSIKEISENVLENLGQVDISVVREKYPEGFI